MTSDEWQLLVDAALIARNRAYAPYSKFQVGAALMVDDAEIFLGCNIENASYGMTICAERVAVSNAIAAGKRKIRALAIAAVGGSPPCGACRQVLAEFCDDLPILLVAVDDSAKRIETSLGQLLPQRFALPE